MMRRCALVVLLILIVPTGTANTNSVVKIDHSFTLIDYDPGIESVSNHDSSEWVVVAGASGYAIVMDKNSPSTMIPLAAVTKEDLLDSDYHPGGNTALVVGKNGTALRYSSSGQTLEVAASQQDLGYDTVQAISWNANGQWAYLGTAEGSLFRMRTSADGGAEVLPIPGTGGSSINALDCLPDPLVCIVASQDEGIGIIDRDHVLSWVGGSGSSWTDITCVSSGRPVCVAIATDRQIAEVTFDTGIPIVNQKKLVDYSGMPTSIGSKDGGLILIVSTPAEILEHRTSDGLTYTYLTKEDVLDQSFGVAGSTITGHWGGEAQDHWIITRDGTVALLVPVSVGEAQGLARVASVLALGAMGLMLLGIWSTRRSRPN